MAKFVKVPSEGFTPIEFLMTVKEGDAEPATVFAVGLLSLLVVAVIGFALMRRRSG